VDKTSGRNIPRTLRETCDPRRMALLVYDMQVGIVSQQPHGPEVTQKVAEVLGAAREEASRYSSAVTCRYPRS
jgi:hypothetical protein